MALVIVRIVGSIPPNKPISKKNTYVYRTQSDIPSIWQRIVILTSTTFDQVVADLECYLPMVFDGSDLLVL